MTQLQIPLNELRFGHDADPPINARRVGRLDDIEEYAASLAAHGLIQALNVRQIDGSFYVEDGNKRLAALQLRAERGEIAADSPIKCDPCAEGQDSEERSVAANLIRAPLHPADTYETFRELRDRGMSPDQIASRFGIDVARVHRMLALGSLTPIILEAWRAGEFGRDALACVRAFTLAKSPEDQERVYLKLKKDGRLSGNVIKTEFGANNRQASVWLKTCGVEAYITAGGHIIRDLFGDDHVVYDLQLAEQLAADRVVAEMESLAAEGWAWVSRADDLPQGWSYSWFKLTAAVGKPTKKEALQIKSLQLIIDRPGGAMAEAAEKAETELADLEKHIAARGWSPDQLAKAGAVVAINHYGEIVITRGVVRPSAPKKEPVSNGTAEKKVPMLSNALHQRLSVQATLATRAALQQEPRVGFVALLAGFMAHSHNFGDSPIRVLHQGFGSHYQSDKESFADAFARLSAMSNEELFKVAAGIASEAIHLERDHVGRNPFDANASPLAAAIDPEHMTAALRETFDAADYFGGASKPFVLQAIREAINDDEARKAEKLKKAELVDFAMKNVASTGWLPPELRSPNYDGPKGGAK